MKEPVRSLRTIISWLLGLLSLRLLFLDQLAMFPSSTSIMWEWEDGTDQVEIICIFANFVCSIKRVQIRDGVQPDPWIMLSLCQVIGNYVDKNLVGKLETHNNNNNSNNKNTFPSVSLHRRSISETVVEPVGRCNKIDLGRSRKWLEEREMDSRTILAIR